MLLRLDRILPSLSEKQTPLFQLVLILIFLILTSRLRILISKFININFIKLIFLKFIHFLIGNIFPITLSSPPFICRPKIYSTQSGELPKIGFVIYFTQINNIRNRMQSLLKNNNDPTNFIEKECIFDVQTYKFGGSQVKSHMLTKTFVKRKFTQDELSLVTKLYHKNVIGLKKIGKSKKVGDQEKFCLYYESVPYSLQMVLARIQFDVRPQTLEAALNDIKNYLLSERIAPSFSENNIGANQNGVIKVYISVENVLKPAQPVKNPQQYDKRIKEIKNWYGNLYSRRSIKPSSQIPQTISGRRLSQSKLNKLVEIKCDIEKMRKKIRSQQSKNNSVIGTTPQGDKKIKLLYNQLEPNSFTINIYNELPNLNEKTTENREIAIPNTAKIQQNDQPKNIQKEPVKYYDYDEESVDTYQMEMGEDFQMPSMRTNQRLRQTVLNSKKSWDTMTHKTPTNINKKKKNICQSAGTKDFFDIVENNKRLLKQVAQRQSEANSDNKTVQDSHSKQKNWQSSTIKSTLPPNIQDRVQQALMKTKNVMQMLKNTKSFSAGK